MKKSSSVEDGDVKLAVQSLLEIPDQYRSVITFFLTPMPTLSISDASANSAYWTDRFRHVVVKFDAK
uniref:Uncharacterized protein n=1 Tax=Caenorhabditis japonica TaxID=281687 RepID=A0A8R1IQH2_CAEJA